MCEVRTEAEEQRREPSADQPPGAGAVERFQVLLRSSQLDLGVRQDGVEVSGQVVGPWREVLGVPGLEGQQWSGPPQEFPGHSKHR